MLVDSNILIYATKPEHEELRQWLIETLPKVSVISKVELCFLS
jgi:predicted nucleic acid-binding protein